MSILFIVPYFGSSPAWLNYYVRACTYNPDINWLFYGNFDLRGIHLPVNVKYVQAELDNLNKLLHTKLNINTNVKHPYKLCDYRPAYYEIFSEYIKDFTFWGYCDLDLIFGNIQHFLTPYNLADYEVITSGTNYLAGPFTLYRNQENINHLYRKIWRFKRRISDQSRHYCLDEGANYIGNLFVQRKFFMKNKPLKLVYRITRSLRYRILKRIPFVQDITNMIFIMEKKDQIKILRLNMQRPDTDYLSRGIYTWNIQWKKGVLTDLADGKELLYFHFLKSKNREFDVSSANPGDDFTITQKGIGY